MAEKKQTKKRPQTKRAKPAAAEAGEHSRTPVSQAEAHQKTRRAHAMETAEDYLEMITDLIAEQGEARTADIARRLGVSHVTVVRTLSRLKREGLVQSEPYRSIFPTKSGEELARRARERHETVLRLLAAMGVSQEVAEVDAEGIEHHLSEETLAAFQRYLNRKSNKGK